MTANVARLALPFTDGDLGNSLEFADIRVVDSTGPTTYTVSIPLPSSGSGGLDGGYYNGGSLGTGDTTTETAPTGSLAMAFAIAIKGAIAGFELTVVEDINLPGKYKFTRQDAKEWQILWADALTTFDPVWLGFLPTTYSSISSVINATWQSDRLWRGSRPTWNRRKLMQVTSHVKTLSGGVSTRQI